MKCQLITLIIVLIVSSVTGCSAPGETPDNAPIHNVASDAVESGDRAVDIIFDIVGKLPKGYYLNFDHIQDLDGKKYFVVQHYEGVIDNPETGDGHSVTIAWYYVEKASGDVYILDIKSNELLPVEVDKEAQN